MATDGKVGHLERTATEPRDKNLHTVTIGRIEQANETIRLFRLDLQTGPIKFLPGQWLDTFIPGNPKAGGFTITSAPSAAADTRAPYLELAVQHAPDGPAGWLWRPASEIQGAELQVRVGGSFVYPPHGVDPQSVRRLVFVAGGVGINPLMSMLSALGESRQQAQESGPTVEVLYATKAPRGGLRQVLFVERIAKLFGGGCLTGRLRLHVTGDDTEMSKDGIVHNVGGAQVEVRNGRLSVRELRAIAGEERGSTLVYVCGPPNMTDEFVEALAGPEEPVIDRERVMLEKWW